MPVPVKGLAGPKSVVSDSIGYCALLTNDTARCCGNDSLGELGDGSKANPAADNGSDVPVTVVGLSGVERLVGTGYTFCAQLDKGGVKCWGYNNDDELGDGKSFAAQNYSVVPESVQRVANAIDLGSNLNSDFCATLASGLNCAVLRDGGAACWGWNSTGELGGGTVGYSSDAALKVVGLGA